MASCAVGSALLLVAFAACSDDGGGGGGVTPGNDAGPSGDDGGPSPGNDAGRDGGSSACEALGKSCVDAVSTTFTSLVFDDTSHPIVAYTGTDGLRVRRWSDTKWEAVAPTVTNRNVTLGSHWELQYLGGKLYLLSTESTDKVHVETLDAGAWHDVAGSPFTLPAPTGNAAPSFAAATKGTDLFIAASISTIDPVYVKKWDGAAFTDLTESAGFSRGTGIRIAVASDGALSVALNNTRVWKYAAPTTWTEAAQPFQGETTVDTTHDAPFRITPTASFVAYIDSGPKAIAALTGDGTAWSAAGGNVETYDFAIGYPKMLLDAADKPIVGYSNVPGTNVTFRAKRFDGTAWISLGDTPAVLAPTTSPPYHDMALKGSTLGFAGARRVDPTTPYVRYDELTIP